MRTKSLSFVLAASAIVLGCAPMPPKPDESIHIQSSQKTCDDESKKCPVKVSLLSKCPTFNNCLGVDTEFVLVTKKAKVKITWELSALDQKDFSFAATDAIRFDPSVKDHFDCKTSNDGKSVECKNNQKNTDLIVYKYVINVIVVHGVHAPVDPYDPWIVNS